MISLENLHNLLKSFLQMPTETERIEFKEANNDFDTDKIGKYFSALSNESFLKNKDCGWIIFGVNDKNHKAVGTNYRKDKKNLDSLKKQISDGTGGLTFIEIYEIVYENKRIIMFQIPPAITGQITKRKGFAYGRDGECIGPLNEYEIEIIKRPNDWSANIINGIGIEVLDENAILLARKNYFEKNKSRFTKQEIDTMDDEIFLNKAKITINGKITNSAIILLGKEESSVYLSPSVSQISWIVYNERGDKLDYEHFSSPMLLNIDKVYNKIRNLNYRYIPDGTLFPTEITMYDPWVIREALNNAIAHQDYLMCGRILLEEKVDEIIISNLGSFIPGSIENVLQNNAPEKYYRNRFLVDAMVNLGMIDTIGSGIIKMFNKQKERYFPLPEYDLQKPNEVKTTLTGKIIDDKFTRLLIKNQNLSLDKVILLDKVQKGKKITLEESKNLRKDNLIDGKYPKIFISLDISQQTNQVSKFVKNKIDKTHYEKLVIDLIKNNKGQATRKQINEVLIDKLSDIYDTEKSKLKKIRNILGEMRKKGIIKNIGNDRSPIWILTT